jgi:signal transduction histidine kinase
MLAPTPRYDVAGQRLRARALGAEAATEAVFATLKSLLRTLSHTLGNPLAGLSLTLELLAGTALSVPQQRYVDRCLRVSERLNTHKDNWGRLGSPPDNEAPPMVELRHAIEDVLVRLRLGPQFHVDVALGENAEALPAHAGLLVLALMHLVRNAAEAQEEGGVIGIVSRRQGGEVHITVWDEGSGLSPEAERDLWIRPHPSKAHGAGLGLFWVAAIVEDVHRGHLSYSSHHPHGAAFSLALPVLVEHDRGQ